MGKALTIAGSDTSSGAGIQADLRIFSALHVYGTSVITVLTAQNTRGVSRIVATEPSMVRAQIASIMRDIKIDAIKIGMVYNKGIISSIASALKDIRTPIILDPILRAGTGARLLRDDAYGSFVKKLVPIADLITPNKMEAEKLADMVIHNIDDARAAAKKIAALGAKKVIVKGGHMHGRFSTDVLYHGNKFYEFTNERIKNKGLHGAGCAFSAALTAEIANGKDAVSAAKRANEFVRNAIVHSLRIGKGLSVPAFEYIMPSNNLLASLQKVVHSIEDADCFGILIPESQSNIVYAKPNATSIDDIAGVYGRIVRIGAKAKAAGSVGFGASLHVAAAVLAMMQHDRSIRSAINIKYDKKLVATCEKIGLKVSSYDRRNEPEEVKSMEGMSVKWGMEQAIMKVNAVPDIVYHLGDWGKEPMILVFGTNPMEVYSRVISVLQEYKTRL